MIKKEFVEKLEDIRREYLDYYNDHKLIVADYTKRDIWKNTEALNIDVLTDMQEQIMERTVSNEYEDCMFIGGLVHAIDNLIKEFK